MLCGKRGGIKGGAGLEEEREVKKRSVQACFQANGYAKKDGGGGVNISCGLIINK